MKLYYAVSNCGDGSVSVHFYESQELADFVDEMQQEYGEGWGEPSVSSIKLEGDNITCPEAITPIKLYVEWIDWIDQYNIQQVNHLIDKFFGGNQPQVTLSIKNKNYYNIHYNGKILGTEFQHPGNTSEEARAAAEEKLNKPVESRI